MSIFNLKSNFKPAGDQPAAIKQLLKNLKSKNSISTLLGVTGSGKTFTMANVIQKLEKPTLVITHNKTLAAQLFQEFRELFPDNRVEYFVSYYDYYQPEAYLPGRDLYIEKDSSINEKIDRLRHSATAALLEREDVIVVSSVSCIYGLGSPDAYRDMNLTLRVGEVVTRDSILERLVDMQYKRTNMDLSRNNFRVQGDVIEIYASYSEKIVRVELFGDEVDRITEVDRTSYRTIAEIPTLKVYPAQHYVMPEENRNKALMAIEEELEARQYWFKNREMRLEHQRISERTRYDLEMIREVGYCSGIENYSRHLDGRKAGEPPSTLIDYFPKDFLMMVDESHMTIPQINGMFNGDRARKKNLIDHGYRLPSAYDNRPLRFPEFERYLGNTVFVSATPGDYELKLSKGRVVEQLIRPTGLVDPKITICPAKGQVDDLIGRIKERVDASERVLVTTLTKRMAEDLTRFLQEHEFQVAYLHSEVETLERTKILRDLRLKKYDILVGINLLREGIDLPEVSLVAILDADKEGFLRSARALIQNCGRAARNSRGEVIFYADKMTKAIQATVDETERRRKIQIAWNKKHGIVPTTIIKAIHDELYQEENPTDEEKIIIKENRLEEIMRIEAEMMQAAMDLDFEQAAKLRDILRKMGVEPGSAPKAI